MFFLDKTGQNCEDPNVIFMASALDFEFKSISFHANWPVIGVAGLAIVAAWLVYVLIRRE